MSRYHFDMTMLRSSLMVNDPSEPTERELEILFAKYVKGDDGVGISTISYNPDYTLTIYLTNGTSYNTGSLKGEKGDDGLSPHIGENGNWWIGTTDLDIKAQGPKGDDGERGERGEKGESGYSPLVRIQTIEGGHRVIIYDETHPYGQSFDVMDGHGGGGTGDYEELDNLPSINNIELKGNKTSADLGLQPAISDLLTIRSGAELGATALQPTALNPYRTAANQDDIDNALGGRIEDIEGIIPSQASESNELADKAFVNSTVGTNTAIFRGTFNSVAELEAYSGDKTNNDYAFVIGTDSAGNTIYNRYKYNDTTWVFEYSLNNSSFTATQWATINSGLSSSDKTALDNALVTIAAYGTRITAIEGKESGWDAKLSDAPSDGNQYARKNGAWAVVESSGGTTDYTDLTNKPKIGNVELSGNKSLDDFGIQSKVTSTNKIPYTNISGTPTIPTALANLSDDSTHRVVTDTEKAAWNGKQDTISDLSTIRSNATAGKDASDTIGGYGNIVTHNTSEFATAAQGAKADSALQEHQSLADYRTSAQQDVIDVGKEDSTNKVTSLSSSSTDTQYPSAKAVYDAIQPKPIANTIPTGGMLPDVMYTLGTISADPNVTISNPQDGKDHEWMLTFSIGATAPASVTFPSNVQFPGTATFEANKHYEVSIKWDANDSKYYGLIQTW